MIDPKTYDQDALFGSLDKHHIVFFSEGGGDTYENLMLVCANCHRKIHRDKVPPDELRQKKLHWINMKDVVRCHRDSAWPDACVIHLTPDGSPRHSMPLRPVDFVLESVNLRYRLMLSESDLVLMVAGFVMRRILRPLGQYDHNQTWVDADHVRLAPRREPESILYRGLRFGDDDLADVEELVGILVVPLMCAMQEGPEFFSPEKVAEILWGIGGPLSVHREPPSAEFPARVIADYVGVTLHEQLPSMLQKDRTISIVGSQLAKYISHALHDHGFSHRWEAGEDWEVAEASMLIAQVVSDTLTHTTGGVHP